MMFISLDANAAPSLYVAQNWKAGVARVNITPRENIWMGGYAFRDHPAEGKLTDLWAKALALEDGNGQKAVIVTLDLVGISKDFSDKIRQELNTRLQLSKAQIILNASHTHTGPVVGYLSADIYNLNPEERKKVDDYAADLEKMIIDLVINAFSKTQPVRIFSGNGISRFQVNRHSNKEFLTKTGTTYLNGPNDYAVPVLKVMDANNKILAILFGYACHNTTLQLYQWSGDYAGFAQIELEKKFPGVVALFFQGAGADQNPLPRSTVALAQQYGKTLASAVEAVLTDEMKPLDSKLTMSYAEIDLPFARKPPTKDELTRIIGDSSSSAYPDYLKRKARRFLNTLETGGTIMSSYPWYPVQVWNLGGQALFAFGGELTVGYAIDIKRVFGQDVFVMGYSNNIMSYIPTAQMLTEGGYEVTMSPVFTTPYASTIENIIIDEAVRQAGQLGIPQYLSLKSKQH
ncbi:MAG: neutral/alkaline non-lysosomal ceramidase N-terminal domain-containing protein [Chitinophagaceae bacterium]|nr:neutral/alkaline non-lysosomal ceramidase N-terminal domain-containing protein [Chitinophagaceae bacterium]